MNAERRERAGRAAAFGPPHAAPGEHDAASILKQLRAEVRRLDRYVEPERRAQFRREMDALLNTHERRLHDAEAGTVDKNGKTALRRARQRVELMEQSIVDVSRQVKQFTGDGFAAVKEPLHRLHASAEHERRRLTLQIADNPAEVQSTLHWLAERGDEDDLYRLRAAVRARPYADAALARLAAQVEKRLVQRVYDPQWVAQAGEATYLRHRAEWDVEYAGEHIAIARGGVVAHSRDKGEVMRALLALQKEHGLFRAYVVQIGAPVLDCSRTERARHSARALPARDV